MLATQGAWSGNSDPMCHNKIPAARHSQINEWSSKIGALNSLIIKAVVIAFLYFTFLYRLDLDFFRKYTRSRGVLSENKKVYLYYKVLK